MKKIFWRNIVIFHTKYPKNVCASLRSAHFFKCAPPPPRLTWNPGSAPDIVHKIVFFVYNTCRIYYFCTWGRSLHTGAPTIWNLKLTRQDNINSETYLSRTFTWYTACLHYHNLAFLHLMTPTHPRSLTLWNLKPSRQDLRLHRD